MRSMTAGTGPVFDDIEAARRSPWKPMIAIVPVQSASPTTSRPPTVPATPSWNAAALAVVRALVGLRHYGPAAEDTWARILRFFGEHLR